MQTQDEKLVQAQRVGTIAAELVKAVVEKAENRTEATAALRSAIEIISVFQRPASDSVDENS